jgi:hypothetical protein
MPDYTKLAMERDVFGELGWVPNFSVKNSKNNDTRHDALKEFFDSPRDYAVEFHKGSAQGGREFYIREAEASISELKPS